MKINKKSIGGQIKEKEKTGTEKNGEKTFLCRVWGDEEDDEGTPVLNPTALNDV